MAESRLSARTHELAPGRLGPIRQAHDATTGQIVTIESVALAPSEHATGAVAMLRRELHAANTVHHPNLLHYTQVIKDNKSSSIILYAPKSLGKPVARVLKDFGRLHALAVRKIIRGLVSALLHLHETGATCCGVSLSSLFLQDSEVVLACWFPSIAVVQELQAQSVLADDQWSRTLLQRRVATGEEQQQDRRSVAYVMVEMLTGERVRGRCLDTDKLHAHLAPHHAEERRFLQDLMAPNFTLAQALSHAYLDGRSMRGTVLLNSREVQEQRRVIAQLTERELRRCQEVKQQQMREIRTWFAQFEKRMQRKPKLSERPPSVARLQVRCRMLAQRIVDLETRLSTLHKSFYRPTAAMCAASGDNAGGLVKDTESQPFAGGETLEALDVSFRAPQEDEVGTKRSPAQKAFLKRLSDAKEALIDAPAENTSQDSPTSREGAKKLMQQRREISHLIDQIESDGTRAHDDA